MLKSFFILPIHNKECLILDVLNGIKTSHSNYTKPVLICILDGCVDDSERIVRNFKEDFKDVLDLDILYQEDVHEITCLNVGLKHIKDNYPVGPNDLIFMVQDDVILEEPSIDLLFEKLFEENDNLGYVSMRLGVSLCVSNEEIQEFGFIESEFGHWDQMNWNFHTQVKRLTFRPSEIAIRSPTCVQWKRYLESGFFDQNLSPCGFDCHDMSIRMNMLGYINGVFALKYRSDVGWGSMRSNSPSKYNSGIDQIYSRNRKYLAKKHKEYFNLG